jgi:ketosteroid isomerase-like protein
MSSMDDEQEIHSLFEAGDRALMATDIEALSLVFADDYVQYDPSGKAFSKQGVLESLRSGDVRYPSIVSTGRRIRLFGDVAIVHGSELDEVEADGKRFPVRYLYMDLVCKRDGRWQIVGSQLVKLAQETSA